MPHPSAPPVPNDVSMCELRIVLRKKCAYKRIRIAVASGTTISRCTTEHAEVLELSHVHELLLVIQGWDPMVQNGFLFECILVDVRQEHPLVMASTR